MDDLCFSQTCFSPTVRAGRQGEREREKRRLRVCFQRKKQKAAQDYGIPKHCLVAELQYLPVKKHERGGAGRGGAVGGAFFSC